MRSWTLIESVSEEFPSYSCPSCEVVEFTSANTATLNITDVSSNRYTACIVTICLMLRLISLTRGRE